MKKVIFIPVLFFHSYTCLAQKVDKFCVVSATVKAFNKGMNIFIDLGKDSSLFSIKDKSLKERLSMVTKFTNLVDALNYMSSLGWTLVTTTPYISSGSTYSTSFFFRKDFDQSELDTKTIVSTSN